MLAFVKQAGLESRSPRSVSIFFSRDGSGSPRKFLSFQNRFGFPSTRDVGGFLDDEDSTTTQRQCPPGPVLPSSLCKADWPNGIKAEVEPIVLEPSMSVPGPVVAPEDSCRVGTATASSPELS